MRTSRSRLLLGVVLSLCLSRAWADQLQWVAPAEAERAALLLRPGTLVVLWISHMPEPPRLYRLVAIRTQRAGADDGWQVDEPYREVRAFVAPLAVGRGGGEQPWTFEPVDGGGRVPDTLDLAYTYVPSLEVPGMFVNLGKKLGLACDVRHIALEVPATTLAMVTARGE